MGEQAGADRAAWEAEMFRLLAENVKDYAIFVVDPHRHVLTWSRGAERLLGFTEEEILGKQCDCFFTPEDVRRGVPQKELDEALTTGRGDDDRWHMRKDGTRFWAGGVVTPLKDESGRLRGFAKIMRDRTELKKAADAAHERERQLYLLTDHAPVLIAHCDLDRRYKFVNKPYAARFGLNPSEVVGRHVRDILGAPAYAAIERYVDTALAGERVHFEVELPYAGQGPMVMRCAYDPEFDAGGRVVGFVAAIVNATEARQARDALRESEQRLRTLSDNLPHGAVYQVVGDPEGRRQFAYVSAGVERVFGVTPAEAQADASALYALVHEDDRPRVAAAEEAALRNSAPFDCEFRSWTRSGGIVWVHARSAPRHLPTGQTVWEGVITDVTARKTAEAELAHLHAESERQRRLFDTALSNTSDYNFLFDLDGRLIYANRALLALWGGPPTKPWARPCLTSATPRRPLPRWPATSGGWPKPVER
jgi:PAS domain S-box-containing protein